MSSCATHDKITFILSPIILLGAWWFIGYYATLGLELGNISHTFMDWMSTGFKKIFN